MAKENNKIKEANKTKKEKKHFFKDLKAELKKVIWPTPKQLVNNTIAVITIVLITAVIVFALDFVFETANTYGVDALKSAIESNKSENTVEDGNAVENTEGSEDANVEATNTETTEQNTTDEGTATENTTTEDTATQENTTPVE